MKKIKCKPFCCRTGSHPISVSGSNNYRYVKFDSSKSGKFDNFCSTQKNCHKSNYGVNDLL